MNEKCEQLKELKIKIEEAFKEADNEPENDDIRIVILQRGWVMVGRYKRVDSYITLDDASVIRAWGTTKGLGELASNGPIANKTILDKTPQVEFHTLVEVANIRCKSSKWIEVLK